MPKTTTPPKSRGRRHLETRDNPKWLWSHRDKAKIIALLAQKGDDLSEKIAPADLVLARTFNPQGKVRQPRQRHQLDYRGRGNSRFEPPSPISTIWGWPTGKPATRSMRPISWLSSKTGSAITRRRPIYRAPPNPTRPGALWKRAFA